MIIYEPEIKYNRKDIEEVTIENAADAYAYLYKWFHTKAEDITREHIILVGLNNKQKVVFTKILTIGTDNQTLAKPSDIIKHVLMGNVNTFILAHNHPSSGNPAPSTADMRITRMLRECANIMELYFQDHIILGEVANDPLGLGYYSFREAGII
jgi:DNA repair protein RadC